MLKTHRASPLVVLLVASFAIGGATAADASPAKCSAKDAQNADAFIDHLDTWAAIARMAKTYRHCDDGEIAEGISEAVARLLADRWETLPALEALVAREPALRKFVLSHIDSTLDADDLGKIGKLTQSKCPPKSNQLCMEISHATERALI